MSEVSSFELIVDEIKQLNISEDSFNKVVDFIIHNRHEAILLALYIRGRLSKKSVPTAKKVIEENGFTKEECKLIQLLFSIPLNGRPLKEVLTDVKGIIFGKYNYLYETIELDGIKVRVRKDKTTNGLKIGLVEIPDIGRFTISQLKVISKVTNYLSVS